MSPSFWYLCGTMMCFGKFTKCYTATHACVKRTGQSKAKGAAAAATQTDYSSVREEVVQAYAQQAEEMGHALEVLQTVSGETSDGVSAAAGGHGVG